MRSRVSTQTAISVHEFSQPGVICNGVCHCCSAFWLKPVPVQAGECELKTVSAIESRDNVLNTIREEGSYSIVLRVLFTLRASAIALPPFVPMKFPSKLRPEADERVSILGQRAKGVTWGVFEVHRPDERKCRVVFEGRRKSQGSLLPKVVPTQPAEQSVSCYLLR